MTILKGLASALKLDLGLFSTKRLVEQNALQPIEMRIQRKQKSDDNFDPTGRFRVWRCESDKAKSNIAKYAQYQAASFQESLQVKRDGKEVAVIGFLFAQDCITNASIDHHFRRRLVTAARKLVWEWKKIRTILRHLGKNRGKDETRKNRRKSSRPADATFLPTTADGACNWRKYKKSLNFCASFRRRISYRIWEVTWPASIPSNYKWRCQDREKPRDRRVRPTCTL